MLETALRQLLLEGRDGGGVDEEESGGGPLEGNGGGVEFFADVLADADGHVGDLARRVMGIVEKEMREGGGKEGMEEVGMEVGDEAVRREKERVEGGEGGGKLEELETL